MVVGEAPNARRHALGRTGGIRGPQIEPSHPDVLPVMKQFHWKRKVFESAQKIFVAPGTSAGAKIGFGHGCLEIETEIGTSFSVSRFELEARGSEAVEAAPQGAVNEHDDRGHGRGRSQADGKKA